MRRNRIGYTGLLLCAVLLLLFYHNYFFFLVLIVVAALPVFSYVVARTVFAHLTFDVSLPIVFVEEKNRIPVRFTVNNDTVFPMPGLHFTFRVENQYYPNAEQQDMALPIYPGKRSYDWSVCSIYAGQIRICGEKLQMQDYLGLFRFQQEWREECASCVLPALSKVVMDWVEAAFQEGEEEEMDTLNSVEDVTQVREVREYRPGDRLQRIHWKLSTKQDDLYVKEYEREYNRTLTLLVELKRDSDEIGFLNAVITAFYSTAHQLIEEEQRFLVQWFDVRLRQFQTEWVQEEEDLLQVLQQIYMMQTYDGWEAYEKYREGERRAADTAIYFTSVTFPDYDPQTVIGTLEDRVMLVCL